MLNIDNINFNKTKIELQVKEILCSSIFSLNVVNRYKENIIHISAANNCISILKCILQKHNIFILERKNAFGWTPLMQAIRNENTEMVKYLLKCGVVVDDFSFLGMSVLSLSCAISKDMFNIIYNSCPSSLEFAIHDDINPLCVAALKNDKEMFFKLIDLGVDVSKSNAFTHIMIKQSKIPEIVTLGKSHLNSEDYWNDIYELEYLLKNDASIRVNTSNMNFLHVYQQNDKSFTRAPEIAINFCNSANKHITHKPIEINDKLENIVSPTLSYITKKSLILSPNAYIANDDTMNTYTKLLSKEDNKLNIFSRSCKNQVPTIKMKDWDSPLVLQRCQTKRPPNLKLRNSSSDSNATLSFTPQFTPIRTPNLPYNINEENVFDESTPTPPKYKTPPRGIILDPSTTKLIIFLQKFGLERHIPIFLEQEVDIDLFLTLTDIELVEIGIKNKTERLILLSVINEIKNI